MQSASQPIKLAAHPPRIASKGRPELFLSGRPSRLRSCQGLPQTLRPCELPQPLTASQVAASPTRGKRPLLQLLLELLRAVCSSCGDTRDGAHDNNDNQANLHSRSLERLLHELDDRKLLLGLVGLFLRRNSRVLGRRTCRGTCSEASEAGLESQPTQAMCIPETPMPPSTSP